MHLTIPHLKNNTIPRTRNYRGGAYDYPTDVDRGSHRVDPTQNRPDPGRCLAGPDDRRLGGQRPQRRVAGPRPRDRRHPDPDDLDRRRVHRRLRRPAVVRRRDRRPLRSAQAAHHRSRRVRIRCRGRHGRDRSVPADRPARGDGCRGSSDHAHDLVGHHHVVPGRGPSQGHRCLGRRRRWGRGARSVRQRAAARVLLLELVLRPERRSRRSGAGRHRGRGPELVRPGRTAAGHRWCRAVAGGGVGQRVRDHRGSRTRLGRATHRCRTGDRSARRCRVRALGATAANPMLDPQAVQRARLQCRHAHRAWCSSSPRSGCSSW